ncbi:MAG: hypothetical protein ACXWA9_06505 [Acidimicrobiia bacterium]
MPVQSTPAERVRAAYLRRNESDYIFEFWSAFGWTVLTCGYYLVYVVYQLVRRSRDHNLRRLELLDAANAVAWERANAQGLQGELQEHFQRVATHLESLRRLTTEFRDPAIWLVLAIVARGIVELVAYVLLDGDLVKHDFDEGGAENELAYIFTRLGTPVATPDPNRLHQPQNYVGRIVASIFSCGVYTFFWLYNMMEDGNHHFMANWAWEDSLAQAVQQGAA